jgi:hypothetical protein
MTSTTWRCPACCTRWARRQSAGAAAEPGRRLRRRRHDAGLRRGLRRWRRKIRQGPGGGRRHDGRRRAAGRDDVRPARLRRLERCAREANLLDGGAPFYDCYACADGKFISIGAIEPQFYAALLALAGVEIRNSRKQWRQADWPELKAQVRGAVRHPHARRMVRAAGRDGRLLRARARHGGGAAPSAQRGARHLRRTSTA